MEKEDSNKKGRSIRIRIETKLSGYQAFVHGYKKGRSIRIRIETPAQIVSKLLTGLHKKGRSIRIRIETRFGFDIEISSKEIKKEDPLE